MTFIGVDKATVGTKDKTVLWNHSPDAWREREFLYRSEPNFCAVVDDLVKQSTEGFLHPLAQQAAHAFMLHGLVLIAGRKALLDPLTTVATKDAVYTWVGGPPPVKLDVTLQMLYTQGAPDPVALFREMWVKLGMEDEENSAGASGPEKKNRNRIQTLPPEPPTVYQVKPGPWNGP